MAAEEFTGSDRTSVDIFCLRSVESGQMDYGGYDKYVMFKEANFVSGKAVIDLSKQLRPGARFDYTVMGYTRTHVGGNATVDGKTLAQGQAVLDKSDYTDAGTGIVGVNVISGSGDGRALIMIIFDPHERA